MSSDDALDLRDLAPPEPLERALAALGTLPEDDCLHLRFPREPMLLYPLLEPRGFTRLTHVAGPGDVHVLAWRARSDVAAAAARAAFEALARA